MNVIYNTKKPNSNLEYYMLSFKGQTHLRDWCCTALQVGVKFSCTQLLRSSRKFCSQKQNQIFLEVYH